MSKTSSTAIDHIWTNITNTEEKWYYCSQYYGSFLCCAMLCIRNLILQKQHASRYFTSDSLEKIHLTLKKVDLSPVLQELDLDKSYATSNELLHNQFEIIFPLKSLKKKSAWF